MLTTQLASHPFIVPLFLVLLEKSVHPKCPSSVGYLIWTKNISFTGGIVPSQQFSLQLVCCAIPWFVPTLWELHVSDIAGSSCRRVWFSSFKWDSFVCTVTISRVPSLAVVVAGRWLVDCTDYNKQHLSLLTFQRIRDYMFVYGRSVCAFQCFSLAVLQVQILRRRISLS